MYAFFIVLIGACSLSGCGSVDDHAGPPNVVIITMDTVRADHLGCYGYPVNTTPQVDALAAVATRYARFVASSSWTVPTHASFFTGKFAFEHGAHGFQVRFEVNNVNGLPAKELTLAEVLLDEGYATGAFVANEAYLGPRWQLDQGFETYHVEHVRCPDINRKAFAWLDSIPEKPFLLFVNYMDVHRPYNAQTVPGLLPRPVVPDDGELVEALCDAVMPGTNAVPPDLQQKVIDQYDTALRNLDAGVGALIEKLKSLDRYDNTVLVVESDHGEFFGEHLLVEHSKDVYEEVLSVPLIIKYPGQTQGAIESTTASAPDLPHLILSAFSGDDWAQHRLKFPNAPGNHEIIGELYYTRLKDLFHPVWGHRFRRIRTAFYDWPFKYINSTDGVHELYNLEEDPVEAVNLVGLDEATAGRLAGQLRQFLESRVRSDEQVEQKPLTKEERRRLKSLGYVGN
ncbi:sulfatase [bacterium]|nr:sulfatase [bacterium]